MSILLLSGRRLTAAAVVCLACVLPWDFGGAPTKARSRDLACSASGFVAAAREVLPSVVAVDMADQAGRSRLAAGFVVLPGRILTAAHAIDGARAIAIVLADGERRSARRLALDRLSDLALLGFDGPSPQPLALASTPVAIGMPVAAIGDPLGYRGSVTAGIVSALDRAESERNPFGLIQHDAALNPGSSGGPLVDGCGRVVGVNLAIADGARHHLGIGLALPAGIAAQIVARLDADGSIVRPALGLTLRAARDITGQPPDANTVGEPGAYIEALRPGGAAERAGWRAGMGLIALDGRRIGTPRDVAIALEPHRPGDILDARFRVGAETLSLQLVLDREPEEDATGASDDAAVAPGGSRGLAFAGDVTVLAAARPGSAAALAGLSAGDRILAVGSVTVVDSRQAWAQIDAAPSDRLVLLVERGGVSGYVVIGPNGRIDAGAPFGSNAAAAGSTGF